MSDSANPQERPERRRANRIALRLGATMREPNRGRVEARLIDISTHGCRVEAISGASPDSWLWLN
ncbi:MAG TPA: PilZ domain-containing protein, partial [Sphingomicrobium sp.]|nr:PilZ domain-containing protein [Sphingomicrobium sp.]